MKHFIISAAQGEITLTRIGDLGATLPAGYTPLPAEDGQIIVGHSETGHHHTMEAAHVTAEVMDRPPEGMRILRLIVQRPTALAHHRGHDTHAALMVEPGVYEARIQREYDPYQQLARRVAD